MVERIENRGQSTTVCEPAGHFGSTSFTVRRASMILISSYIPIKLLVDVHAIADFDWILAMESIVVKYCRL